MGLDLTIVPIQYPSLSRWVASQRLCLERDDLVSTIDNMKHFNSISKHKTFEYEEGQPRTECPDGSRLTYVEALSICTAVNDKSPKMFAWNKAIVAFLRTLPQDTIIVLWWH